MDLIRNILLQIEVSDRDPSYGVPIKADGYDDKTISYHVWLLINAGLVQGDDCSSADGFNWQPTRLTWNGQEFLQAIKDDTLWNKAKEKILKPTASWTFSVLMEWLKQEIKAKIGIP